MHTHTRELDAHLGCGLLADIPTQLPCNSGIKLAMMELDDGVKTTVESLLQISRIRLSLVVHALASALETLSKVCNSATLSQLTPQYSNNLPLVDAPLDTIHSQLYVLHLLVRCLSESWRLNSSAATPTASDLPTCWPDPPPLDDHLARHLLGVLVIYMRMVSDDSAQLSGALSQIPRDGKSPSSASVASWAQEHPASTGYSLGPKFIQEHSYPSASASGSITALASEDTRLIGPAASSIPMAIKELTKCTSRIVFFLSASNWPLVLSRIKARVAHLTTTLEDNPELVELRLLEWANVDSSRLAQALQEISTPFLHVKRPAQTALASALRNAIWNWIDVYPAEYQSLIEGTRKLDGSPDVLFDVLSSMSDATASNKRVKVFYPLMAMLLVLSPESMKRIALGESSRGNSSIAKKASFMENLRRGLGQSKSFEACAVCYVDLVRAGVSLSPRLDSSGIRSMLPDLQSDLKNALFYSSLSTEINDQNVLVEGLVALYRYNPSQTASHIFPKLWNDSSDISKIIGVRACKAIVLEGQRLPWQQSANALRADVAASLRAILKVCSS